MVAVSDNILRTSQGRSVRRALQVSRLRAGDTQPGVGGASMRTVLLLSTPPGRCAGGSLVFSVCFSVALRWSQGIESTKESSSFLQWLPAFCWFWQLHMRRAGSCSHQPSSFFSPWWSSQPGFREGLCGLVTEQAKWMESSFFVTVGAEVGSEPCTDTAKTACAFIRLTRSSPSVTYAVTALAPGGDRSSCSMCLCEQLPGCTGVTPWGQGVQEPACWLRLSVRRGWERRSFLLPGGWFGFFSVKDTL